MSTPWHTSLPQKPLFFKYREREPDNRIDQEMDVGPPKSRQRSTSQGPTADVSFIFRSDQLAIFKTLYRTTLAHGALPYEWVHPEEGTTYDWKIISIPDHVPIGSFWYNGSYSTLWETSFRILQKV